MRKIVEVIESERSMYNGLKVFGALFSVGGFFNPTLWALAAGIYAVMVFIGNQPNNK